MLHPWELSSIRTDIEKTFIELCDVYRRTGNPDEYGGDGDAVKVLSTIKCDLHPVDFFRPTQIKPAGDRLTDIVYYSLGVPVGTPIREGDVVDVYTQGIKVTLIQVQRGESDDAFLHAYATVFDNEGWFELSFHEGDHHP